MGLLPLLTSMFLSSYFHPGSVVDAQRSFTITNTVLSMEPSTEVTSGTNVTIRCKATVSSSVQEELSREYTIYKDGKKIYAKTTSSSEDLLYPLPDARVSNTGKYNCTIGIKDKKLQSNAVKLTVTGLSKPILHLNKDDVREGEEVTALCTAPGETGSIYFSFYENSVNIRENLVNSNQIEVRLRFSSVGVRKINCSYTVMVIPESFKSEGSNTVNVKVRELSITPVLEIYPQSRIYEGDPLNITCTIRTSVYNPGTAPIYLYLIHGTKLLSSGETKVNYSTVALAKDPEDFECRLEMENVEKVTTQKVSVIELFSPPTITMSPTVVFQKEDMSLTCNSEKVASERLNRNDVTYSLEPPDHWLSSKQPGVFSGKTMMNDFNYTCVAQAKGITKHSATLTVQPKVAVSIPKISVSQGRVILGEPFEILCHSDSGSYPINYTLLWDYQPLNTTIVRLPTEQARFKVTIRHPKEIEKFMCEAKNNHKLSKYDLRSKNLNAIVTVPLSKPTLTAVLSEVSEGDDLYLICGAVGSVPVTFKFYHNGVEKPIFTNTSNVNNINYHVKKLTKEHSGMYHCEAMNQANTVVSGKVKIEVYMALWKKALIGGVCLLVLSLLVLGCVLYFKSKRDAVPLYNGMEGRATNGTRGSVASLPADISNKSSYSASPQCRDATQWEFNF